MLRRVAATSNRHITPRRTTFAIRWTSYSFTPPSSIPSKHEWSSLVEKELLAENTPEKVYGMLVHARRNRLEVTNALTGAVSKHGASISEAKTAADTLDRLRCVLVCESIVVFRKLLFSLQKESPELLSNVLETLQREYSAALALLEAATLGAVCDGPDAVERFGWPELWIECLALMARNVMRAKTSIPASLVRGVVRLGAGTATVDIFLEMAKSSLAGKDPEQTAKLLLNLSRGLDHYFASSQGAAPAVASLRRLVLTNYATILKVGGAAAVPFVYQALTSVLSDDSVEPVDESTLQFISKVKTVLRRLVDDAEGHWSARDYHRLITHLHEPKVLGLERLVWHSTSTFLKMVCSSEIDDRRGIILNSIVRRGVRFERSPGLFGDWISVIDSNPELRKDDVLRDCCLKSAARTFPFNSKVHDKELSPAASKCIAWALPANELRSVESICVMLFAALKAEQAAPVIERLLQKALQQAYADRDSVSIDSALSALLLVSASSQLNEIRSVAVTEGLCELSSTLMSVIKNSAPAVITSFSAVKVVVDAVDALDVVLRRWNQLPTKDLRLHKIWDPIDAVPIADHTRILNAYKKGKAVGISCLDQVLSAAQQQLPAISTPSLLALVSLSSGLLWRVDVSGERLRPIDKEIAQRIRRRLDFQTRSSGASKRSNVAHRGLAVTGDDSAALRILCARYRDTLCEPAAVMSALNGTLVIWKAEVELGRYKPRFSELVMLLRDVRKTQISIVHHQEHFSDFSSFAVQLLEVLCPHFLQALPHGSKRSVADVALILRQMRISSPAFETMVAAVESCDVNYSESHADTEEVSL